MAAANPRPRSRIWPGTHPIRQVTMNILAQQVTHSTRIAGIIWFSVLTASLMMAAKTVSYGRSTHQTTRFNLPQAMASELITTCRKLSTDTTWSEDSREHSGLFKVVTEAVTLTPAPSEASSSRKLTIAKYLGNWYYKYTSPAGGACSSDAVSVATATATGLAADTEYTFTAYSDENCTPAKALGTSAATRTLMSKVTNVAVGRDDQQLLVSWDSQTGATSYDVQWKSGTQEWASSR